MSAVAFPPSHKTMLPKGDLLSHAVGVEHDPTWMLLSGKHFGPTLDQNALGKRKVMTRPIPRRNARV